MKSTIVLIDGGFLRSMAKVAGILYDPPFIAKFAHACIGDDEECLRNLYYDCAPFVGNAILPVSGNVTSFTGSDRWLHPIAALDLFAVRRGVLKFRGFKRRSKMAAGAPLTDSDFTPQFEQKGVDMRIGLDIAAYSTEHLAKRIILVTNDTDCVPAMKFARKRDFRRSSFKFQSANRHPDWWRTPTSNGPSVGRLSERGCRFESRLA